MIHIQGNQSGKRLNMRTVKAIQLPSEGGKFDYLNALHFIDVNGVRYTKTYKSKFMRNAHYIYLIIRY